MLIRFLLDKNGFICVDAPALANASTINYLKCKFDFEYADWKDVDAVVAIFKSATYNVVSEVLLDSNNECYVDPEVYKRGGTIQCKLVGDKYLYDQVISSSHVSDITEFYINENVITPTPAPSKYDVFVAELEKAEQSVEDIIAELNRKVENGDFDGADGVGISTVAYNSDGTLTVTLTDGTSFISEYSMKGEKGDTGEDGVGISNIAYGEDGTVVITLTDGTTFTSEYSMKGEKGDRGELGYRGFSLLSVGAMTITDYTDPDIPAIKHRKELSEIMSRARVDEVFVGDTIEIAYTMASSTSPQPINVVMHYHILKVDETYAYFTVGTSLKGAKGDPGDVSDIISDGESIVNDVGVAYINTFEGSSPSSGGTKGLVPTPLSGDNFSYLQGSGLWTLLDIVDYDSDVSIVRTRRNTPHYGRTIYEFLIKRADSEYAGLMSNTDKVNLDDLHYNALQQVVDSSVTDGVEVHTGGGTNYTLLDTEQKGVAGGVCPLDSSNKIDSSYLPIATVDNGAPGAITVDRAVAPGDYYQFPILGYKWGGSDHSQGIATSDVFRRSTDNQEGIRGLVPAPPIFNSDTERAFANLGADTVWRKIGFGIEISGAVHDPDEVMDPNLTLQLHAFNSDNSSYHIDMPFPKATSERPGLMSAPDKAKLDASAALADLSTLLPTDTASGSIASFPDGQSVIPALSVVADIEPIQSGSGTPSLDNIRPISGHDEVNVSVCGVNVWDEEWEVGAYSPTTGEKDTNPSAWRNKNYISIKPNTQYYFYSDLSSASSGGVARAFWYDENKDYISFAQGFNSVKTSPNNAYYCNFRIEGTRTDDTKASINYPSTDHEYHAYNGTTYTTDLGQTVYGGTLDVVSGVLTVTKVSVDMTAFANNWTVDQEHERCYVLLNDAKAPSAQPADIICNRFETASATEMYSKHAYGVGLSSGKALQFRISGVTDQSTTTVTTVTNYFANNPTQVVYELATPQTYQLTPTEVQTLLGQNNIWNDCGDTEVTYKADVTKWVEKQQAQEEQNFSALIAPTEATDTASRNYVSGSLLIMNDTLYKTTANIQSGGTITPNTNVTATTLAEVIASL